MIRTNYWVVRPTFTVFLFVFLVKADRFCAWLDFLGWEWVFTLFYYFLLGFNESYLVLTGFTLFFCTFLLPNFTVFYRVLSLTWFHHVILGFSMFHQVLLGFTQFLMSLISFTGLYSVLIRFYRVLLSFKSYLVSPC